jgi:hypothetical protein
LVKGLNDYDAVGCVEPGTANMYAFWTQKNLVKATYANMWGKDGSSMSIDPLLLRGTDITIKRSIDGSFAKLNFAVGCGNLFDPYNTSSLWSSILKKGRKIVVQWGESIGGTTYWQSAGTYYITSQTGPTYQRGEYPSIAIEAEDRRCLWQNASIIATDIYNNYPDYIIKDILIDFAGEILDNIDLPTFSNQVLIANQWIDTSIIEIINQICNRFGYFFRYDVANKATVKQITNNNSIDHTYTNADMIISFTPDDKYSDFTNRVVVQGQEKDFTAITMPEEPVTTLNGTVGWWGFHKDLIAWYSDDHSKRCINPRLEVIETATSIGFKLAGNISEYLTDCPAEADYRYCTVTVEAPNLIPILVSAIETIVLCEMQPDILNIPLSQTITVGSLIERMAVVVGFMVLGSVGSYQYQIHAQPLGSVRRSVQAQWDDTAQQTEIGAVISRKAEDPLCYSVADCQVVADFEGLVLQLQRKRISIDKIAHLQDEEGDTIRFVHPYSGQSVDLFVTDITRTMRLPETDGGDGHFIDTIEGWVLNQ